MSVTVVHTGARPVSHSIMRVPNDGLASMRRRRRRTGTAPLRRPRTRGSVRAAAGSELPAGYPFSRPDMSGSMEVNREVGSGTSRPRRADDGTIHKVAKAVCSPYWWRGSFETGGSDGGDVPSATTGSPATRELAVDGVAESALERSRHPILVLPQTSPWICSCGSTMPSAGVAWGS